MDLMRDTHALCVRVGMSDKRYTVIPPDPPVACTGRVWLRETS